MSARYSVPKYKLKLVREGTSSYPVGIVNCFERAVELLGPLFRAEPTEAVALVFLNAANVPMGVHVAARGGTAGCALTPADLFRAAIVANATAVIMAHNHPSGDPSPSADDLAMTRNAIDAGRILGVTVLDHLIFGRDVGSGEQVRSLRDHPALSF